MEKEKEKGQIRATIRWCLIVVVAAVLAWVAFDGVGEGGDSKYPIPTEVESMDVLISPLPIPHMQYFPNGWVELFGDNPSYEWPGDPEYNWHVYPAGQTFYEPGDARDGDWALIQGRSDPRVDEVAYHCWGPGELWGYHNFILQDSRNCESNDVHQMNQQWLWLIYWDPAKEEWFAIADDFSPMSHTDCEPWMHWEDEAFSIVGLEAYRGYDICLAIGSEFPGIFNSYFWRDHWTLLGRESVSRLMFPHVGRNHD